MFTKKVNILFTLITYITFNSNTSACTSWLSDDDDYSEIVVLKSFNCSKVEERGQTSTPDMKCVSMGQNNITTEEYGEYQDYRMILGDWPYASHVELKNSRLTAQSESTSIDGQSYYKKYILDLDKMTLTIKEKELAFFQISPLHRWQGESVYSCSQEY